MKFLVGFLFVLSSTAFAQTFNYECRQIQDLPTDRNVGVISISGDPVSNVYESIKIDQKAVTFKVSERNPSYIYLYDQSGFESYALEVVNTRAATDSFTLSVFRDFIVLRSNILARYSCLQK